MHCLTTSIWRSTSIPSTSSPNTTCLPSSQSVLSVVMKNWEPLVFGPELAMDSCPVEQKVWLLTHRIYSLTKPHSQLATKHQSQQSVSKLLTWSRVLQDKVLIVKLAAVDGLAPGSIVVGEVPSLAHKLRDDAMEAAALEAKTFLMCA